MSQFETRLADALTSGAEQAPDADGLASAARTRARRRRRTGYAVGACAVVMALAIPAVVLARGNGGDRSPDDNPIAVDPTDEWQGWQTVEHEGVLVDVPRAWKRLDTSSCEFGVARFGPPSADPCTYDHAGLAFYGSATFDPKNGAGVLENGEGGWSAYVYTGDWAIYAQATDLAQSRRILGSARLEGEEAPDLSAGWRTESYAGLSIDVPADWREGALSNWCVDKSAPGRVERPTTRELHIRCTPHTGYGVRLGEGQPGDWIRERSGPAYPEGSWAGVAVAPGESTDLLGIAQVVAPTQALAELIGGSLVVD